MNFPKSPQFLSLVFLLCFTALVACGCTSDRPGAARTPVLDTASTPCPGEPILPPIIVHVDGSDRSQESYDLPGFDGEVCIHLQSGIVDFTSGEVVHKGPTEGSIRFDGVEIVDEASFDGTIRQEVWSTEVRANVPYTLEIDIGSPTEAGVILGVFGDKTHIDQLEPSQPVYLSLPAPRSLASVFQQMPQELLVHALDVVEDSNRKFRFQLAPPTRSTEELLVQYDAAYQRNFEFLSSLLLAGHEQWADEIMEQELEQELKHLEALNNAPKEVSSISIVGIHVSGPDKAIADLRTQLRAE